MSLKYKFYQKNLLYSKIIQLYGIRPTFFCNEGWQNFTFQMGEGVTKFYVEKYFWILMKLCAAKV